MKGTWDVASDEESADSVYFDLGEFTFSAFDKMDDGSSMIEDMMAIGSSLVTVTISHTFKSGTSFTDEFKFKKKDVSYDRESREVTIKSRTDWTNGTPIDVFITGATTTYLIEQNGGGGTQYDCVHISDLIEGGFSDEVNSSGTFSIASDNFVSHSSSNTYVAVNNGEASNYTVEDVIFWMAAVEGGILGSMLGYNFYEYRLDTTNAVTLSESDVESINLNLGAEEYFDITVTLDNSNINSPPQGTWSETSTTQFNTLAKKSLSVSFSPVPINRADWQGSGLYYADAGTTLSSVVVADGVSAYGKAYGADGAKTITLTVHGIETIKPYEPITLDTSFPAALQNTTWRPSEIEYDFMADKVNLIAYEI